MQLSHLTLAPLILSGLPGALAWGSLGHITVAYLASRFVAPQTETYLQRLLRNDTDAYLAGVATWADSIRYTKWGHFTGVFHFIDAKDDPPRSCSVDMDRDCKDQGCVVTALQNYTSRMMDLDRLREWERAQAAKFVVHFVGDMHQPLHDEDVARGGNGIHVLWHGREYNLHSVWDSAIAEQLRGGVRRGRGMYDAAKVWADELEREVKAGRFRAESEAWLDGVDLADPVGTALIWARQGNAFVCSHVLPEGPEAIKGQELSGKYYEEAAPVIESQVARAGFRLARWLDLIVQNIHHSSSVSSITDL
ncbi:hypothetical protein MCOR03_011747 [Pyricularia oryzae]|nr:hypothetical protein MCOR01_009835 [Pyricularia oryzae]KAI6371582.1 hypothetical protein MCOR31_004028 [Pyricularia oryzae]KAI6384469.1 hypothetical protein MCOR23_011785 [Pyricularia oryzae]KAI6423877.1 hypothetical protein MCOR24_003648 [Pyricularia oryzae]KAI6431974.1 hypothetical protein MCOR22_009870 [Pyricularia oryzae]